MLRRPLASVIDGQRGHLFPWVPVCLGAGVGTYFAVPWEPPVASLWGLGGAALLAMLLSRRCAEALAPLVVAMAVIAAGYALAGARAHAVAAPVLPFRYYGPIEGRVVLIDRSASDKMRLTLDRVVLLDVRPDRRPDRVRVSLHYPTQHILPRPGMRVATTGHLSAPEGPVEPGGFDFRRMAWFDRIGAVGYSRLPLVATARAPPGLGGAPVHRVRMAISRGVQARLPGAPGAFAAAILTGDRSAIPSDTLQALRDTNLAHLLAISGLHMGLLTGFVFAALRVLLVLHPRPALTWPVKKIAAAAAILAGAAYYALSGGNVATERAFIMVTVALIAVLLDRRALTLRAVAIAAVIVLLLRPEELTGPGFQMSFSATAALVGAFAALRDRDLRLPRWAGPILAVVLSSFVAGAATAPFAAAHFNRLSDYGLLANLMTVPLMGLIVMPAAVLAACLWPLGLSGVGLWLMKWPVAWILGVAHHVADWPGSVTPVPSPPAAVLPLVAIGGLFVLLWQGRARWLGIAPLGVAVGLWAMAERPAILISPEGGLMGVMTAEGRVLSKPRGQGFAARVWLENDGDRADQPQAHARPGLTRTARGAQTTLAGTRLHLVSGRGWEKRASAACRPGALVIVNKPWQGQGCEVYDSDRLRRTGAVALSDKDGALHVITTRDLSGTRLWSGQ